MLSKAQLQLVFGLLGNEVYGKLKEQMKDEIVEMNAAIAVIEKGTFAHSVLIEKKAELIKVKTKIENLFRGDPSASLRYALRIIEVAERLEEEEGELEKAEA